ncbi:glyoxalase/bleomycin resistance protein/dioxygenase [Cryobacterium roopkundense]|uniref:Glyoxalase/bleomycin resistance protein/dioxygenase n=1 Tax=Cryobacterium roopkundense TaxID=1001240 RepID=A0A099J2E7_9MICO|nr:VOC family protein [Cryobacterium roopkundense]KGJ71707.1 glyoxalase/bleomycin resistance protein/dioxygenase [Cryobacterium roopkundense]MBB5642280.1 putative glyoxalase superfamily protein PhnB [Cryobacterium roopkundense]
MNEKLCAYLSYEDAPAALWWMTELGFAVVRRQDGPANEVIHAEVRLGDVVLMVASTDAAYARLPLIGRSTGRGLYLLVDDVDGYFDRALAAGGTAVIEPEDTEWGTRRARVLDPEDTEWTFGTYEPGAAW